jgi:hypothetical protein
MNDLSSVSTGDLLNELFDRKAIRLIAGNYTLRNEVPASVALGHLFQGVYTHALQSISPKITADFSSRPDPRDHLFTTYRLTIPVICTEPEPLRGGGVTLSPPPFWDREDMALGGSPPAGNYRFL